MNKPSAYEEHKDEINTGDIQFPLRIRDIGKLERLNNLSINVFSLDYKSHVIPIRISDEKEVPKDRVIDLLYVVKELQTHYCLITNIAGKFIPPPPKLRNKEIMLTHVMYNHMYRIH